MDELVLKQDSPHTFQQVWGRKQADWPAVITVNMDTPVNRTGVQVIGLLVVAVVVSVPVSHEKPWNSKYSLCSCLCCGFMLARSHSINVVGVIETSLWRRVCTSSCWMWLTIQWPLQPLNDSNLSSHGNSWKCSRTMKQFQWLLEVSKWTTPL